MIPDQLRLVPVYILFNNVVDRADQRPERSTSSVILVLAISADEHLPDAPVLPDDPARLEEAAKIDGAGFFTTFRRVMLPLATPALAAVAILQFQGTWNSFFWPLVLLQDADHWTLPLGLGPVPAACTTRTGRR